LLKPVVHSDGLFAVRRQRQNVGEFAAQIADRSAADPQTAPATKPIAKPYRNACFAARVFRLGGPMHPYTQALVSAVPSPVSAHDRRRAVLKGDPPNPRAVPSGCAFRTRCPSAASLCITERPLLKRMPDGRQVACHFAGGAEEARAA
jgi:oligopeptide/dipeptide ABC transporter ATP-binding protein